MLLISTYVAPSPIQGLGLFAAEDVPRGAKVWAFAPGLDQLIPEARVPELPAAFQDYLARYAYTTPAYPGMVVLSCDHAKFMNHSEDPNTEIRPFLTLHRGFETAIFSPAGDLPHSERAVEFNEVVSAFLSRAAARGTA